jgi:hypothetical protein
MAKAGVLEAPWPSTSIGLLQLSNVISRCVGLAWGKSGADPVPEYSPPGSRLENGPTPHFPVAKPGAEPPVPQPGDSTPDPPVHPPGTGANPGFASRNPRVPRSKPGPTGVNPPFRVPGTKGTCPQFARHEPWVSGRRTGEANPGFRKLELWGCAPTSST